MATNQESVLSAVITRSGSTGNLGYNGEWLYLFDQESIAAGMFNERMLTWLNAELSPTVYTNLTEAQNAYAVSLGFANWSSMNTIDPGVFDPASLFAAAETGFIFDLTDATTVFQERSSPITPSTNGDPIGTLLDLSPNGNDIAAPSDGQRPTYGISGDQAWVLFASANSTILTGAFTLNQTVSYVFGIRHVTPLNGAYIADGSANEVRFYTTNDPIQLLFRAGLINIFGDDMSASNQDLVITARASGGTSRIAINNAGYDTGFAGANNPGGITFGGSLSDTEHSNFRLYRAIGIGRDLTDGEIANCRQWCAEAAGVTL